MRLVLGGGMEAEECRWEGGGRDLALDQDLDLEWQGRISIQEM